MIEYELVICKNVLPRLLIMAMKMKIKDVTAPYPIMAKATVLLFINIFLSISYSPVKISTFPKLVSISVDMGLNKAAEKK